MRVLAKEGTQCPREEDFRKYIADTGEPAEVPNTVYYRRCVADGSLRHMPPVKTPVKKKEEK